MVVITSTVAILSVDHSAPISDNSFDPCLDVTNNTKSGGFIWQLSNSSYISVNTTYNTHCETQMVLPAFWNVQYTPQKDAYSMGGVPVAPLAAGVPYCIDQGFDCSFGLQASVAGDDIGVLYSSSSASFNWVTQCFPVLTTNPVSCRESGEVTISDSTMTVEARGCTASKSFPDLNSTINAAATVVGICTGSSPDIGTATVVIGSIGSYAQDLSNTFPTATNISYNSQDRITMSVACTIDIAPSVGFRLLNFSRNLPGSDSDSNTLSNVDYSTHVTVAGNYCTPISPSGPMNISQFLTSSMLTTGGSAAWQLLSENQNTDGRLSTLMQNANSIFSDVALTFPDSQNNLEDSLGQASAIALGLFWGYWSEFRIGGPTLWGTNPIDSDTVGIDILNGNASLEGVRAGSGSKIALLYVIPELFSAGLLIWLLYCARDLK